MTRTTDLDERVLSAAVDRLIPGDAVFPRPSQLSLAAMILRAITPERLSIMNVAVQRLVELAGKPFEQLSGDEQDQLLRQVEQDEPTPFMVLREMACYCYYAHPQVLEVLRGLGYDVNDSPLPRGYAMTPFDESALPAQRRGNYLRTEDVRRQPTPLRTPA